MLVTSIFSFSHSVFKGLLTQGYWKSGLCGKELKTLRENPFENTVGNGENADNQHFLRFQQCFRSYKRQILPFEQGLRVRLQILWIWKSLKFFPLVKGWRTKTMGKKSVYLHLSVGFYGKRELSAIAECINLGQPAQSVYADLELIFLEFQYCFW